MSAATVGAASPAGEDRAISQAGELRSARVESLRALAALAVVATHVFVVSDGNFSSMTSSLPRRVLLGGGAGVWLFFALTGYLLFLPFARHVFAGGDSLDLRRYAVNRALRILPLYYAAVVVFMITQSGGGSLGQWWRFGTLSENFFTSTVARLDGPMWSLVVEVHFYLLLPFLAYGVGRLARGRMRTAAVLLLALGLASAYVRWVKVDGLGSPPDLRWEYSLPATFLFFVPGMLLALGRVALDGGARRPRWLTGPIARSDLWLAVSAILWVVAVDDFRRTALCAVAAFLTVGACVLPLRHGPVTRALDWRPLAILGVASYSLYIWHFPLISWFHPSPAGGFAALFAIAVPLSIAVALLSYRSIEAPFLRLRRRWTKPRPEPEPPASATVAVTQTA